METFKKIDGIVEKSVERFQTIKSVIENVDLKELGLSVYTPKERRVKGLYCAIDGSKNVQNLGDVYLIVAKAVKVVGEVTLEKKVISREPVFEVEIEDDYMGEDTVNNDSIRLMINLETSLLRDCDECNYVLLDGPIVDPPVIDDRGGKQSIPSLKDLARVRSQYVLSLIEKGKVVLGIAKRFSERFIVSLLKDKGYLKDTDYREKMVVDSLLSRFVRDETLGIGVIKWDDVVRGASEVDKLMEAYEAYKEFSEGRLKIASVYVKASRVGIPSRVDIAYTDSYDVEKALSLIATWEVKDKAELNLLTVLADTLSSVSNYEVKQFREYYTVRTLEELKDSRFILSNFILRKKI
ncbi:DNA double-strand break repair nuclease NurA [Stygiolobus caldivivus]|uniref:NurA domain-containing protein n=1 Tax=Stygiolobus caldivivus TaxID=2824673 RepID=A0A8D5U9G9_9CREN|nr:DNA double-strand break repair nuclease NurA [Stygiolobus caldivivus]BCU71510.1 hypothetical protein KN1_28070 [Stygiolobus caldivivus]